MDNGGICGAHRYKTLIIRLLLLADQPIFVDAIRGITDLLKIDDLERTGLQSISLDVPSGTCIAIRGQSGAGKSLLLRAIADLDPNSGHVSLNGKDRNDFAPNEWRRDVCYVPAESGWWYELVGSHFEYPDIAAGYLVRLGFADDVMPWRVDRLSTGERQRMALLRAMVQNPKVLLLDEPTSALDPEATAKVESLLHEKIGGGVMVVLVTHDKAQAARMSSERYLIEKGALHPEDAA